MLFLSICLFLSPLSLSADDIDAQMRLVNTQLTEFSPIDLSIELEKSSRESFSKMELIINEQVVPIVFFESTPLDPTMFRVKETYLARLPAQPIGTGAIEAELRLDKQVLKLPSLLFKVEPISEQQPFILIASVNDGLPAYIGQVIPIDIYFYFLYQADQMQADLGHLKPANFALIGKASSELIEIRKDVYLQKIRQFVMPEIAQEYLLGPSKIQARAFRKDFFGKIIPAEKSLSIEAPKTLFSVKPLPAGYEEGFNGLVGRYEWNIEVENPDNLRPGGILDLKLELRGSLLGQNVFPPDFSYIPQFRSSFLITDVNTTYREGVYTFDYAIRITDEDVTQLPELYWSYFDPDQKTYVRLSSSAVELNLIQDWASPVQQRETDKKENLSSNNDIVALKRFSLESRWFKIYYKDIWILGFFYVSVYLFVIILLPKLAVLKQKWRSKSDHIYDQAQLNIKNWGYYRPLMEKAILEKLYEKGYISKRIEYFNELDTQLENESIIHILKDLDRSFYAKDREQENFKKGREILEKLFFSL